MKKLIVKNFISIAILSVMGLIFLSAGFSFYNSYLLGKAIAISEQSKLIKAKSLDIYQNIRHMDISIRGYALIKEDRFLFLSSEQAHETNKRNFATMDSLLALHGYDHNQSYELLKLRIEEYTHLYDEMIRLLREDKIEEFKNILKDDRGKELFIEFRKLTSELFQYEDNLYAMSTSEYEAALLRDKITQIFLLLIGLPTLALIYRKFKMDGNSLKALLRKVEENNYKYLFNPGKALNVENSEDVLESSISHLEKAADFINEISLGNYEVQWEELNDENAHLNKENLVGKLIQMKEQMRKVKLEDEKRLWSTEGLSKISELIRNYQHNLKDLTYQSLVFLIKYTKAQQGSIFLLQDSEEDKPFLEMAASYAFDRKKHIQKYLEPGQGIIGQTFLEGETVMITEVPQNYIKITSGLGDATPSVLIIIPLKHNEKVVALIEIASFHKYEKHEILFLENAGGFIAGAISSVKTTEMTQNLLEQAQSQTQEMKAQEEEMRQNMEELEAMQEEMRRKEQELERQLIESRK